MKKYRPLLLSLLALLAPSLGLATESDDAWSYLRFSAAAYTCTEWKGHFEASAAAQRAGLDETSFKQTAIAKLLDDLNTRKKSDPTLKSVTVLDIVKWVDFVTLAGFTHDNTEQFMKDCYAFAYVNLGQAYFDSSSRNEETEAGVRKSYSEALRTDPETTTFAVHMDHETCDHALSVYEFRCH